MVISTCKCCRGCAIQFGGNSATCGSDSGVCITITHRVTHRLLCSKSSPRKTFLSSPNHRTLCMSLRGTFGCSLFWIWTSRRRISQPWRTSNRMRRPNSGRFQMKLPAGASNNGRIDGASVCARARVLLRRWLGKRHMSYHYSAIPHFRELFDCPSYTWCCIYSLRLLMMDGKPVRNMQRVIPK
jgi:hypothetical protein